jgi:hypothetical protein
MNKDNSKLTFNYSIIEVVDQKLKELEEYKADLDELSSKQKEIKEKVRNRLKKAY